LRTTLELPLLGVPIFTASKLRARLRAFVQDGRIYIEKINSGNHLHLRLYLPVPSSWVAIAVASQREPSGSNS
jgi:hypothetical protein